MKYLRNKWLLRVLLAVFVVAVAVALSSRPVDPVTVALSSRPVDPVTHAGEVGGRQERALLIGFHTMSCKYCKLDYAELGRMFISGKYIIYVFDANQCKDLKTKWNVRKYPTYFLVRDGKVIAETTNLHSLRKYER